MGQLILEVKTKANRPKREQPQKDELGHYYYDHLPDGVKVATLSDFYDEEEDRLIMHKSYIVHSMVEPGKYWFNRVRSGFPYPYSDFNDFLNTGRIYVFE